MVSGPFRRQNFQDFGTLGVEACELESTKCGKSWVHGLTSASATRSSALELVAFLAASTLMVTCSSLRRVTSSLSFAIAAASADCDVGDSEHDASAICILGPGDFFGLAFASLGRRHEGNNLLDKQPAVALSRGQQLPLQVPGRGPQLFGLALRPYI